MDINVNKSTPRYIQYGTEDNSARPLPVVQETRPQHYPLFPLFTARGTSEPQHVSNVNFINENFGAETLDQQGPYFSHQTLYMQNVLSNGNSVMIKRLEMPDAKKAMLRLSVELIPTRVQNVRRNPDGTYLRDAEGDLIVVDTEPSILGWRVRWHANLSHTPNVGFGEAQAYAGNTPQDEIPDAQSMVYPILDAEVMTNGAYGNNVGLRIIPATIRNGLLNTAVAEELRSLMLGVQVVERNTATQTTRQIKTLGNDITVMLGLVSDLANPVDSEPMSLNNGLVNRYNRHNVPGQANRLGSIGRVHVYNDQVDIIKAHVLPSYDEGNLPTNVTVWPWTAAVTDPYTGEADYDLGNEPNVTERTGLSEMSDPANADMLNIFNCLAADGSPYYTMEMHPDSLVFTGDTDHLAAGGDDGGSGEGGRVTPRDYDMAVRKFYAEDIGNEVQFPLKNFVKYPFSCVYDSGFSQNTKLAICNIMGIRRDVLPIFSTHTVYGPGYDVTNANETLPETEWTYQPALTESQENTRGEELLTRIQMTPESEYFGTKSFRSLIFGQAGELLVGSYRNLVSPSLQYAVMCAQFMGAANGKWNKNRNPNDGTNKSITMFKTLSNTWAEDADADKAWAACINKARDESTSSWFWPALTTVYQDKTSVMFNPNMAWAANTMYRLCHKVWQRFVGNDKYTPDQLVTASNRLIDAEVSGKGIFADIIAVIPNTTVTPDDLQRGFTWHTQVRLGANPVRLVGIYSISSERMDDMFA